MLRTTTLETALQFSGIYSEHPTIMAKSLARANSSHFLYNTLHFLWVTVQRKKRLISPPQSALSLPCSLLGQFICLNKWQGCWVPKVVVLGEAYSVSGSCVSVTHIYIDTQSAWPWPNCLNVVQNPLCVFLYCICIYIYISVFKNYKRAGICKYITLLWQNINAI